MFWLSDVTATCRRSGNNAFSVGHVILLWKWLFSVMTEVIRVHWVIQCISRNLTACLKDLHTTAFLRQQGGRMLATFHQRRVKGRSHLQKHIWSTIQQLWPVNSVSKCLFLHRCVIRARRGTCLQRKRVCGMNAELYSHGATCGLSLWPDRGWSAINEPFQINTHADTSPPTEPYPRASTSLWFVSSCHVTYR